MADPVAVDPTRSPAVLSVRPVEQKPQSDPLLDALRKAMPFQVVSETMLRRIAELGVRTAYEPGAVIYDVGDRADDLLIILSGKVELELEAAPEVRNRVQQLGAGDVLGWAALLKNHRQRLGRAVAREATEIIRIDADALLNVLGSDPEAGDVVMSRFATMIGRDYTVPDLLAQLKTLRRKSEAQELTGFSLTLFRISLWLKSPRPYLMLIGFALFLGFWWLAVEVWKLPRFREMPGITAVVKEWLSPNPTYGLSIYTAEYYTHVWVSVWRVTQAFLLATLLGVPLGLLLGWSRKFKEYIFPVFETLRPIPILAWVPLAIVMFIAAESAVIFLTFLASFFATALNTMLGVQSIDESYVRAAHCLGAKRWQVFRHIVIPGALPFIFTGLQISIGVAWFSLVAAEMVSGQYGLGYVINTSYVMVRYPTIVIGMVTLGAVGYITSALVRMLGDHLMQWRVRELALSSGR